MSDKIITTFDAENVAPKQHEISPDLLRRLKEEYERVLALEAEAKASPCLPLQHCISAADLGEPEPDSPASAPNAGARSREIIQEAREAEFEEE